MQEPSVNSTGDEIAELIAAYQLKKHPEGGWYRKLYKCRDTVLPQNDAVHRYTQPVHAAGTSILFMLARGEHSAWHVLQSDETWYFHRGDPLILRVLSAGSDVVEEVVLSGDHRQGALQYTVRAQRPLSAETQGRYSIVGCGQCPGFEYRDWHLLSSEEFRAQYPQLHRLEYLCANRNSS